MAGTFILYVGTSGSFVGGNRWNSIDNGVLTDPATITSVLTALGHININPANWRIQVSTAAPPNTLGFTGNAGAWSVDGNPTVLFSNLPSGFKVTSARLEIKCGSARIGADTLTISTANVNSGAIAFASGVNFINYSITPTKDLLNNETFSFSLDEPSSATGYIFSQFQITGAYIIGPTITSISPVKGTKFGGN